MPAVAGIDASNFEARRTNLQIGAQKQTTAPRRSVERFMPGEGHGRSFDSAHVQGDLTSALGGIYEKVNSAGGTDLTDILHRLDCA